MKVKVKMKTINWLKSNKWKIVITCLIIFFRTCLYMCDELGKLSIDSSSYINYIRGMRTPLYPLIIFICRKLVGETYYLQTVALVQIAVSYIAVYYLYKAVYAATGKNTISAFVTLLYGCNAAVVGWDCSILTESFSVSASVFFLYAIVKYVKSMRIRDGILAIVFSLVATGIKPPMA